MPRQLRRFLSLRLEDKKDKHGKEIVPPHLLYVHYPAQFGNPSPRFCWLLCLSPPAQKYHNPAQRFTVLQKQFPDRRHQLSKACSANTVNSALQKKALNPCAPSAFGSFSLVTTVHRAQFVPFSRLS
ncbi:hypothetical protein M758_4G068800 [Ceratodon purpureus]|nr:hypothetical protein M758_4G068800 [Ceratodon purpureus]